MFSIYIQLTINRINFPLITEDEEFTVKEKKISKNNRRAIIKLI